MSDEHWSQDTYSWVRLIVAVSSLLIFFYFRFWVIVSACLLAWKRHKPTLAEKDFVDRSDLKKELLKQLQHEDFYTVLLYGERGSGKSSLIEHALKDRYGVVFIRIYENTRKDAIEEMEGTLSRMIDCLGRSKKFDFLECVFSWCWFEPVIVISLEAKCSGDVFEGIITAAKTLSFENRPQGPRIVVDISGSRAAVEADISLGKRRVVGVRVGAFKEDEAEKFIKKSIPDNFKDDLRRKNLANKAAEKLDCIALKLKEACRYVKEAKPTTVEGFKSAIDAFFQMEVNSAFRGWVTFQRNFDENLGVDLKKEVYDAVATSLLQGTKTSMDICGILQGGVLECETRKSSKVTWLDVGLANSHADYHPLFIDPFDSTVSLAGKAVIVMLRESGVRRHD